MDVTGKRILVTGGTGSLGGVLVRKLLTGAYGRPDQVTVFSRDEDKQYAMRLNHQAYAQTNGKAGNGSLGNGSAGHGHRRPVLRFRVGDMRDYAALSSAVRDAEIIFHAAALKQVPNCEYFPGQAVMTNVLGPMNLVRAVAEHGRHVELVIGISTDKAVEPINVMGMTKAVQERVLIQGNLECPRTRFVCVRYGNVVASRGSVVPLFLRQIQEGGPVTITTPEMTRFLLTLDQAIDTISAAMDTARAGETYVPKLPAARVVDIARVLIGDRDIPIMYLGIRPGEKVHEVLVSEAERYRTIERAGHYVIRPMLSELEEQSILRPALAEPFTSRDVTCGIPQLRDLLSNYLPSPGVSAVAAAS